MLVITSEILRVFGATSVAVDALVIYVELALRVVGPFFCLVCHGQVNYTTMHLKVNAGLRESFGLNWSYQDGSFQNHH